MNTGHPSHPTDRHDPAAGIDPIAVVGLSCRLPRAAGSDAFWRLLQDGEDAVDELPAARWEAFGRDPDDPTAGGTKPLPRGGFLNHVDRFDAGFFGISPREAAAMDPQQRLALELAWEALEDAAIVPGDLRHTPTGVFVGAIAGDYAALQHELGPEAVTQHSFTGLHRGVIAGRVSHLLGLRGPSMTVDTAQSSSLVAVHLAVEALRRGDCGLALAGGVHLNLVDAGFTALERFGGLSPDGRCHVFDARANGFVPGEGGATVVLKPLAAALADGDRVHCVIHGGAVNNDGGGQSLTAPSVAAQEAVLRAACRRSGVHPSHVRYVELHGTGTPVGDPVEAAALGAVYGAARAAGDPLPVGSVKSNLGHLEGAAGVVGLVKVALAIGHRRLPGTLHHRTPHPAIPLDELNLRVPGAIGPWPEAADLPLLAGVSSFGIGGTNCHLILGESPAPRSATDDPPPAEGPVPWLLTARAPEALRAQAARLRHRLADRDDWTADGVGRTLATGRAVLEHRAVIVAERRGEFLAELAALAADAPGPGTVRGGAAAPGPLVFVFPGQGTQWAGMATELLDASEAFAARFGECAEALAPYLDWSPLDVLRGAPGAPALESVEVVQPVLFAVMVSLAGLWRHHGVEPDAVVGHSQGEIAAACVAGALSLADAARIVALRARALRVLSGRGGMASVALPADEVTAQLAPFAGRLTVAAVNAADATVITGEPGALAELTAGLTERGVRVRPIPVDYASHSPQVEAVRDRLLTELAGLTPRTAPVAFYSTVTGGRFSTEGLDADYWYRNLREPVRFQRAVDDLVAAGHRTFVEVSPHPVLTPGVSAALERAGIGDEARVTGTLRRDDGGRRRFLHSLAQVLVAREAEALARCFEPSTGHHQALPTYAFQRTRHWLPAPARDTADERAPWADPLRVAVERGAPPPELPAADRAAITTALPALDAWLRHGERLAEADRRCHHLRWRPIGDPEEPVLTGVWLVVTPPEPGSAAGVDTATTDTATTDTATTDTATINDLVAHGAHAVRVPAPDPGDRGALARSLTAAAATEGSIAGVLSLLSLTGDAPATLLAALDDAGIAAPRWFAAIGAVTTADHDRPPAPDLAAGWAATHARLTATTGAGGGLIDLPADRHPDTGRRLAGALTGATGETQLALRRHGLFAPRLVRAEGRPVSGAAPAPDTG
ncbi:acyltransferase domain-containing protein, partial [Streptomyces sp. 8K308]|uniref:type I polyketide synthase n=1 Tax=Streptomyces sp. 8K308 TaxID=2530388 RepID=UPI001053F499